MATLEESPTLYQGQSWAYWVERTSFGHNEDGDKEEEEETQEKQGGDTMKLRKEDMALFGFCPARDDFYLVVCEICGQVVKPQALKTHIELRHGGVSPPKSEKVEKQSKTMSSQDLSSNQLSPTKQQKGGNNLSTVPSPKHSMGSSSTKSHAKHESKSKRNHSMAPVVRVERISPNMVMKKSSTGIGNNVVNSNSCLPVDRRDIPSPQQPPPPPPQPPLIGTKKNTPGTSGCGESKPKSGSSSSKSKVPKERKLLPCKDRVYDPNKHCGVWISEIGKQCTRSLTCKTHSLAFRRAVTGRKKNFDELLADHRAAKEALLKAAQANKEIVQPSSTTTNNSSTSSKSCSVHKFGGNASSGSQKSSSGVKPKSSAKGSSVSSLKAAHVNNTCVSASKDVLQSIDGIAGSASNHGDDKPGQSAKNKGMDPLYVTHHPRPTALCTFGARHMGMGLYVFDRRMDRLRTILRTSLLEKTSHPPPSKKLCVESKLPPVPDFSDPSDPYSFSWVDHSSFSSNCNVGNTPVTNCAVSLDLPVCASALTTVTTTTTTSGTARNPQTKPNKVKLLNSKQHKIPSSNASSVNRTSASTNNVKRRRTNCNTANTNTSASSTVVSTESPPLPLLPAPTNRSAQLGNIKTSISPDVNKTIVRNNINVPPNLGAVHTIKNHSYPSNMTNAFRDINLVVTSLEVANGQIPPNTSALLGRNITGIHTIANVTTTGLTVGSGINVTSSPVTAVQQQVDKTNSKKAKSTNKGAKTSVVQDNKTNVFNPYLSGILTGGVIVEGNITSGALHSTVTLPAVVNSGHINLGNVGSSSLSPPTSSPSTTPSPLFRSGSVSPQVQTSPVPNGLGPSPPPISTIHTKIANHLLPGANQTVNTVGMISASSPGTELSSLGCPLKAKNSSRHNTCSPKAGSSAKTNASLHHLPAPPPAQIALSRAATVPPRTTKTIAATDITFQQVYANQVLGATQLNQLHLPSKSSMRTMPTGTPPPLAMHTQLPLKFLTTMPTGPVGALSPGQQQVQPSFLLQTDDLRHQEIQGSPSLHT